MFDDDDFDDGVQRNTDAHQGLDEVERALSVLGGRHPEVVRVEREAREAAERRRAELEAKAAAAKKRARARASITLGVVVVLGGLGYVGVRRFRESKVQSARIEPTVAAFVARGFSEAPRSLAWRESEAEADVQDRACVVVVAAPDLPNAPIAVEHSGKNDLVKGSGMFCTCASEHVRATADAPVRILTIASSSVGGMRAIDWLEPRPAVALPSGDACASDAFASWIDGPHAPPTTLPVVAPALAEVGFVAIAGSKPPFTAVHGAAENSCFLATSRAPITLEASDGSAVVTGPSLAWCDGPPQLHVLSGTDAISVIAAPTRRISGLLGLREAAASAGVHDLVTWIADDDLLRVASAPLSACVVPDPAAVRGALRRDVSPSARVVSFVGRAGGKGSPDELFNAPTYDADALPDVSFACEPAGTDALESLCVESAALTWKPHGSLSASGVAYGPLPFWLGALDAATTRDATAAKLAMLRLARRLVARGFDPTIIEGITEKPRGVEVLGRSGEDAIIAVGLWPAPPFVVPYSRGAAWSLDDESPPSIPIQGGARVSLDAPIAPTAAEKVRRTVVFRHAASTKKPL